MKLNETAKAAILALCVTTFAGGALAQAPAAPAPAQADVSESHLAAARKAVAAVKATDQFDIILPTAATQLKGELVRKNPDMSSIIITTVDEETLALVSRRAALETEVARVYTRIFSEQELNEIAAFYATDAGKKLLEEGPIIAREVVQTVEIWQRGIARDLATNVGEKLKAAYEARQGAAGTAPVVPPANQ
jgi:hypothetical protein